MKVFRLATSADYDESVPVESRSPALLAGMLEAATGEPATVTGRIIWPAPELPGILDRWLEREQPRPDIVHIWVNPFWYAYASTPLKIERMGGLFALLGRAGRRASDTPWLSRSRAFALARRVAYRLVGGAYYFEPQEVAQIIAACIRVIRQHEDMVPLVFNGAVLSFHDPDATHVVAGHERRRALNELLAPICRDLGAVLQAPETYETFEGRKFVGRDGMHPNALAQAWMAREQLPGILAAWKQLNDPLAHSRRAVPVQ